MIACHVIKQYESHLGFVSYNSYTVNLSYLWIAAPFLTFSPQTIWDCQSCFFLNSFENWPSQAEVSVADMSGPIHNQFFPLSHVWEGCRPPLKLGSFCSIPPTLAHQYRPSNQMAARHFKTILPVPATTHKTSWQTSCVNVCVFIVIKYQHQAYQRRLTSVFSLVHLRSQGEFLVSFLF